MRGSSRKGYNQRNLSHHFILRQVSQHHFFLVVKRNDTITYLGILDGRKLIDRLTTRRITSAASDDGRTIAVGAKELRLRSTKGNLEI